MKRRVLILFSLWVCAAAAGAQEIALFNHRVQVHGFASQGFAYSNNNNFLTMDTSSGSFALTDFGLNAATQLTEKLRVGAQLYDRNVGRLGNWHPELDWAFLDYRYKSWLGVRGGKVKTVLGLYNDTQDMEFLHTWALLPMSVYPVDVRGDTIAHVGGDLYGNFRLHRLGTWSYTAYGGERQNDSQGGYLFGLSTSSRIPDANGGFHYVTSQTKKITNYSGPLYGADVRWQTPLKGLLVGASYLSQDITTTGRYLKPTVIPYRMITVEDPTTAFYTEYTWRMLHLAGEYRREFKESTYSSATGVPINVKENSRAFYFSGAYRFTKWLEVGSYHSRFVADWGAEHSDPSNHIYDSVLAARFDLNRNVDLKVEGHFMDGAMINSALDRGFYAAANPSGIQPSMKMLVMKVGYHF